MKGIIIAVIVGIIGAFALEYWNNLSYIPPTGEPVSDAYVYFVTGICWVCVFGFAYLISNNCFL